MAVREGLVQPFDAGTWLDLRVGFFLSICGDADPGEDDTITGLAEDLTSPISPITDQFFIGVRNNGTEFPGTGGVVFIGWTNINVIPLRLSTLVSSDAGTGTTNSNYWRPAQNADGLIRGANCLIADGAQQRSATTSPIHFAQANIGGAGPAGYATLLMLRLQRPNPDPTAPVTVTLKNSSTSGDILFSSTPTKALLQSSLEAFTTPVFQLGPVTISAVPDSLFWYWPWHNSRLRVHAAGVEVIAA